MDTVQTCCKSYSNLFRHSQDVIVLFFILMFDTQELVILISIVAYLIAIGMEACRWEACLRAFSLKCRKMCYANDVYKFTKFSL